MNQAESKTMLGKAYELIITEGTKEIFRATFAPVFPHVKSIYSAIIEANACKAQCLINKLNHKGWEVISQTSWKQALIANKVKYVLLIVEHPGFFHGTVPMCLHAY